jgi:hypothetical protein
MHVLLELREKLTNFELLDHYLPRIVCLAFVSFALVQRKLMPQSDVLKLMEKVM